MKTSNIIHILISTLSLSATAKRPKAVMNNVLYGDGVIADNSISAGGVALLPNDVIGGEPIILGDSGVLGVSESLGPGYGAGMAPLHPLLGPDGLPCPPPIIDVLPYVEPIGYGEPIIDVAPYVEPIIPVGGGYGGPPIIDVMPFNDYVPPYVEPIIPVGGGYGGPPIVDVLPFNDYVPPYVEPIIPVGKGYGEPILPYVPPYVPPFAPMGEPIVDVLPFNDVLPIPNGAYGGGFGGGMDVLPFNNAMPFDEPIVPLLKHRCRPRYSEPIVPFQGGGPMGF
jgi:hypothetical protein